MKYIAYMDESGTHDATTSSYHSGVAIIAGFIAAEEEWVKFSQKWRSVLDKYDAPYFHFYDFSEASAKSRNPKAKVNSRYNKNPYKDWELERLDGLFNDCAALLGSANVVPFGSQFKSRQFEQQRDHVMRDPLLSLFVAEPFKLMIHDIFKNFERETKLRYEGDSDSVTFIFDQTDDVTWVKSISDVFIVYQKQNKRLEGLFFRDKKSELPLQAADMIAYRTGQIWNNVQKLNFAKKLPLLDRMILKNMPSVRFEKFKDYLKA